MTLPRRFAGASSKRCRSTRHCEPREVSVVWVSPELAMSRMHQYYHFKNRANYDRRHRPHAESRPPQPHPFAGPWAKPWDCACCPILSPAFRRRGETTALSRLPRICYLGLENRTRTTGCYACAVGAAFGFATSLRAGARMACRIVPSMRGINSTTPASPISWISRLMIL